MKAELNGLCHGVGALPLAQHAVMIMTQPGPTYDWFVKEWEVLHGVLGVGCCPNVCKHHPGLAPHAQRLEAHHVYDLAKLREHGVQRLAQLCAGKKRKAKQIEKGRHTGRQ